jgi:hypothetical protein
MRSDTNRTGFKGVHPHYGRYHATCNTAPCRHNHLGNFGTPEQAAQAYLQHWEQEHPEELEKEQAAPLQVQEHLVIRSDRCSTGFKGVHLNNGRYQAQCGTSPCHNNYLGMFGTPEEAAQAYLQHCEKEHPEELEKERASPLQVHEHLLMRSDTNRTGFKGARNSIQGPVPGYMPHTTLHQEHPRHLRHPRGGSPGVPAALADESPGGAGEGAAARTTCPTSSAASSAGASCYAVGQGLDWIQGCISTLWPVPGCMQHSTLPQTPPRQVRHPRGGSSGVPAAAQSRKSWPWFWADPCKPLSM